MTDHLARAKDYIAKGDNYYGKAADEIIAAQKEDPTLSNVEIGRQLGRGESWVRRLVQSRTTSSPGDEPLVVDWRSGPKVSPGMVAEAMKDPVVRKAVAERVADDVETRREFHKALDKADERRETRPPAQPDRHASAQLERKFERAYFTVKDGIAMMKDIAPDDPEHLRRVFRNIHEAVTFAESMLDSGAMVTEIEDWLNVS